MIESKLFVPQQKTSVQDKNLISDLELLLRGERQGHLAHYHYSEPDYAGDRVDGARLWDKVINHAHDYYQFHAENEIIPDVAEFISRLLDDTHTSLIDLGPGSGASFKKKTSPFLNNIANIDTYMPVDMCGDYLNQIEQCVRNNHSNMNVATQRKNYFAETIPFDINTVPVYLFLSSSVSNLPEISATRPYSIYLEKILAHFYSQMQRPGYLIISHDSNQDFVSLQKAYENKEHKNFSLNLLERVKRDTGNLDNVEFDPSVWNYKAEWCERNECIKHILFNTRPQTLILNGHHYHLPKGRKLVVDNSHKYKECNFLNIANSVGFSRIQSFKDHTNKVVVHILKREA